MGCFFSGKIKEVNTMSEKYNYLEAVKEDVREYINNEIELLDFSSLEEKLNNDLWINDGVTGNASGSYYCNSWKAEEALSHNWDLLAEALENFGQDGTDILKQGAEAMDVTIRCYLLGQAIAEVLEENDIEEKLEENQAEE